MLTTLATGSITLDEVVKYKFSAADKKLVVRLISDGNHKLWGNVKIALTNADVIAITLPDGSQIADYFNRTLTFKRISSTELQFEQVINGGIDIAEDWTALPEGESAVEADVDNDSVDLSKGNYSFFLLDTEDLDFSDSLISIKATDIAGSGVGGVESVFDQDGDSDYLSINGAELVLPFDSTISLKDDDSGVTNIPLVING